MFECRNPSRLKNGDINCEINHPTHGWVLFTASPSDVELHGRAIHQFIEEDEVNDLISIKES